MVQRGFFRGLELNLTLQSLENLSWAQSLLVVPQTQYRTLCMMEPLREIWFRGSGGLMLQLPSDCFFTTGWDFECSSIAESGDITLGRTECGYAGPVPPSY